MHLHFRNAQKDLFFFSPTRSIRSITQAILTLENQSCDELSVLFVTDHRMQQLHKEFFNDPSSTDCICLPIDENTQIPHRFLGEIFICPKAAIRYASKQQTDPYVETTLYLVHSMLHLLGYDDMSNDKKRVMRQAEKRHMKNLESQNLILKSVQ